VVWAVSLLTTDLITRSLTPKHKFLAFGVCLNSVTRDGPLVQTVLYLQNSLFEASPKAISERTSYLQVRLEFHRYPHLIPALFNVRGFGPPVSVTSPSSWTWVDHLVSGLRPHTQTPYSDSLSLRLRIICLTLHEIVTRRFILQKARHHSLTSSDYL
jgi:hypothetical protein